MTLPEADVTMSPTFVPHPVETRVVTVVEHGQKISNEQRGRVAAWLQANGIDPRNVAEDEITLECKVFGDQRGRDLIGFTQYYVEDGCKVHAIVKNDAVKFHRYVEQKVPLEPDPSWPGWSRYRSAQKQQKEGA